MARKAQRVGRGSRLGRWALRACGRRGAAARGAQAEACEARAERSGRGRQARAQQVSGSRCGRSRSALGKAGWAAGARPGRWACGLGARAGQDYALGALDLIFKPIFFSTRYFS